MHQVRVQTVQMCLAAVMCSWPAMASAQYAIQPADTLWYTETTETNIVMRPPSGAVAIASTHEAEIGLTFIAPGSAKAWYAALRIQQNVQDQIRRPDMTSALNRLYHLSFDNRGRVRTDTVPTFSAALVNATDLAHQFADFFISLPAEALRPGVVWVDTLRFSDDDGLSKTYVAQRIRSFRVERDTAVAGASAFVITVTEDMSVDASELDDQGNTITMHMTGEESGTALFSPALGRMLRRERTGHLSGEMKLAGDVLPITMPQRLDYTGTIMLRR